MSSPVIVIDTNKILASILRPGRVRKLLFTAQAVLVTPVYAWQEVCEKIGELAERRGVSPEETTALLEEMRDEVIVEEAPKRPYEDSAKEIASSFDPDDWPFIALALEYGAPVWTNDKDMIRRALEHGEYRAVDTRGVEMLLRGRPWGVVEEYLRREYG